MLLLLILLQAATALIATPTQGDSVIGSVDITGTATHPQFARYEVAFAYDPNSTDSWFEIPATSTTPVEDGILATWDTTQITDGTYMLRLRVFAVGSNQPVEMIIRNVTVSNDAPTPAPTVAVTLQPTATITPTLTFLETTATALPNPTATLEFAMPTPAPTSPPLPAFLNLSVYSSAFCNGAILTAVGFFILGVYVVLRDRIRRPFRRWLRRIMSDIRKP
jgi:hypothetical protein